MDRETRIRQVARELANDIARILRQEYKQVDGEWWLWSLGKPRRPLSEEEIEGARRRGQIGIEIESL